MNPPGGTAAAAEQRPSFNLNVAVEKFSGSSKVNPETFLRTIESAKSLYNWEDKQALAYAGLSLKGKALDWFNNQTEMVAWGTFRRALIDRFGLDPAKMLSKLTKRTQEEKETVRDYADALRTLVRYSRDPHLKATLQHFFTEGLRADVATFVKSQSPKSFEEAVELGEYYEENFPAGAAVIGVRVSAKGSPAAADPPASAGRSSRRVLQDSNVADPVGALTKQLERLTIKLAQFEGRIEGGGSRAAANRRPIRDRRPAPASGCFHCGEEGHLARDCPNRTQAIHLIDYCDASYSSESEGEEEPESEMQTTYYDELYAQSHEEIYAGKRGFEEDESAPAQVARRFKPTPFDPTQLPPAAAARPPPRPGRPPAPRAAPAAQRTTPQPRPREAPAAAGPAGPAARAAAAARVANAAQRVSAANRPPEERPRVPAGRDSSNTISNQKLSYDLVDQLTQTPAKLSIAVCLRAPLLTGSK